MLDKIEAAATRLEGIANRTQILTSRLLDQRIQARVFIKPENFQRCGSFKFRGAYNAISQLSTSQKSRGVITHSSGNHAQAVSLASQLLGVKAVIVMPNNAPQVKIQATKDYGAEIIFCEPTQRARESTCQKLIDENGYTLIHPYDNEHVIQGAATAVRELINEVGNLDMVLVPIGGGGLASGTGIYSKLSRRVTQVIACEPFGADDAYRSFKTKSRITKQDPDTIADGLRTTLSERTFSYVLQNLDQVIRVEDSEIIDAMEFLMQYMKIVVEPSGAIPVAALLGGRFDFQPNSTIGAILSGGNVDLSQYFRYLRRDL